MKANVKDFSKCGECSRCGSCCGPILPLTKEEADRMICIYKNNKDIKELVDKNCTIIKDKQVRMTCPFLDYDNHRCSIYEDRPRICREWFCHTYSKDLVESIEKEAYYNRYDKGKYSDVMTTYLLLGKGLFHNIRMLDFSKDYIEKSINESKKMYSKLLPICGDSMSRAMSNECFSRRINAIEDRLNLDEETFCEAMNLMFDLSVSIENNRRGEKND